jgi:hypothetical protein
MLRQSSILSNEVDFVLENDDVFQLHDFDGSQMFGGLGLGAGFVRSD